jgi:hypothetical protein
VRFTFDLAAIDPNIRPFVQLPSDSAEPFYAPLSVADVSCVWPTLSDVPLSTLERRKDRDSAAPLGFGVSRVAANLTF